MSNHPEKHQSSSPYGMEMGKEIEGNSTFLFFSPFLTFLMPMFSLLQVPQVSICTSPDLTKETTVWKCNMYMLDKIRAVARPDNYIEEAPSYILYGGPIYGVLP